MFRLPEDEAAINRYGFNSHGADAVAQLPTGERVFARPEERRLPFAEALAVVAAHAAAHARTATGNDTDKSRAAGGAAHATGDAETVHSIGDAETAPADGDASSHADGDASLQPSSSRNSACGVPYLSAQDDNLRRELPGLLAALGGDASVDVASTALGGAVDAVNLWVGGPGSVSSMHKDPYDNLMTVVRGVKRFCILPPADVLWTYERPLPSARYRHDAALCGDGSCSSSPQPRCWLLEPEAGGAGQCVPWCEVDPERPDLARFPLFANATPRIVDVRAGETLFLPALWLHQVSHPEGLTVAVNSWRDVDYCGAAWAMGCVLAAAARLTTREVEEGEDEEVQ